MPARTTILKLVVMQDVARVRNQAKIYIRTTNHETVSQLSFEAVH